MKIEIAGIYRPQAQYWEFFFFSSTNLLTILEVGFLQFYYQDKTIIVKKKASLIFLYKKNVHCTNL